MDAHENRTKETPRARARWKHVALFVIACVLFAGVLFCLDTFTDLVRLANDPLDDAQLPGAEFFVGIVLLLTGFAGLVGFILCWDGCLAVSIFLVCKKGDQPRWLWLASLILAIVNGASVVPMTVMAVIVGKWFFT
jgi:hypothetical protein